MSHFYIFVQLYNFQTSKKAKKQLNKKSSNVIDAN